MSQAPSTDRTKAVHYVTQMLNPGDHFNAKDLANIIDRKKSETLRVVNWLIDQGYIEKKGSGPSTSYMVRDHDHPGHPSIRASAGVVLLPGEKELKPKTIHIQTEGERLGDESYKQNDTKEVPESEAFPRKTLANTYPRHGYPGHVCSMQSKECFKADQEALATRIKKTEANNTHRPFLLEKMIEDEHAKLEERLSFLKVAYEKEPIFRNDYLLQFLYGQKEVLEKLLEETR